MRGLNVALRYYSRSLLDFYKPVNLPEHIGLHEIRMVIQEGLHLSFSQGSLVHSPKTVRQSFLLLTECGIKEKVKIIFLTICYKINA